MKKEIIKDYNLKLKEACLTGDIQKVIAITTNKNTKNLVDISCDFNYPLIAACIKGNIDVIKFLIEFPDKNKRDIIVSDENINEAIISSALYGQINSLLFFKNKYKEKYKYFLEKTEFNHIFDSLTMSENFNAIKFIMQDLSKKTKKDLNYALFIEKSIQYDTINCFNLFLPYFKKQDFLELNYQNILHGALYHERLKYLDVLLKKTKLNLCEHLILANFKILLEQKYNVLENIVINYNYKPNNILNEKINEYINSKDADKNYPIFKFLKLLQKKELQEKLNKKLKIKNEEMKKNINKI